MSPRVEAFRRLVTICQEASPRTKVMSEENTRLPRQTSAGKLEGFAARPDLLDLEWKKGKSLTTE
jgi:hypothetical protein